MIVEGKVWTIKDHIYARNHSLHNKQMIIPTFRLSSHWQYCESPHVRAGSDRMVGPGWRHTHDWNVAPQCHCSWEQLVFVVTDLKYLIMWLSGYQQMNNGTPNQMFSYEPYMQNGQVHHSNVPKCMKQLTSTPRQRGSLGCSIITLLHRKRRWQSRIVPLSWFDGYPNVIRRI